MIAAALLAAALSIVAHGAIGGRSFAARLAALAGRTSRRRMIVGWAMGLWITYGLSALLALFLLGRTGDVLVLPDELLLAAWALGLSGWMPAQALSVIGAELAAGGLIGVAILRWRGRRGLPSFGIRYRSPAAVGTSGEWPAAALLCMSAGISEELFFRLLLPLLVAIVSGSGVAGLAIGLAAFTLLHRHQGVAGVIAITLVGALLTALYLETGRLWLAMLVHVAIDLNALILRPALSPLRA